MASQKILLVEDNADDVELALHAFSRFRMASDVVVARDGEQALEYLDAALDGSSDTLPSLILLDLKLPGMDGLEVLNRLRSQEKTRRLPVVILTTSDDPRDIVQGYDLGANSYIRKPVDYSSFTQAMDHLGLYWLALNIPAPH